jgi:phosphoglucosamine mutase
MQMRELFETDGIRGRANQNPMTPEIAMKLGQALAVQFAEGDLPPRIVIGKDPRLSSYIFEFSVAAGACSMGASTFLLGPLPTPAIAFLTLGMRAQAGVVISASHNPYYDNGIKLFGGDGYKLPDGVEAEIEGLMKDDERLSQRPTGAKVGRAYRIEDAAGRYIAFVKDTFPGHLSLRGMKIVVDCANGAAYRVGPAVFEELGATVVELGVFPDGTNINRRVGALHPDYVARVVKREGAHLGIALDGDADRVIMVDEKGNVLDGDAIMALVARTMIDQGSLQHNTVVATIMSNMGLEKELEKINGKLVRTQVGDRYVLEEMRRNGYNFGGEQSGHLIFSDHTTTGDGLIAALQVLTCMLTTGLPLSELFAGMERFPQDSRKVTVHRKTPLDQVPEMQRVLAEVNAELGENGRTVVRYSGTEMVLRLMVEARDEDLVQSVLNRLEETAIQVLT